MAPSEVPSDSSGLPIRQVEVDEYGPTTLAEAADASDYVVVARIGNETGGVRYYGRTSEQPRDDDTGFETVASSLEVETWVKGQAPPNGELSLNSTAYMVEGEANKRIARIETAGVVMPLAAGTRYLLFLKRHPEPFGLTTISSSAGLLELGADDTVSGQVSAALSELRGESLTTVLSQLD